MKTNTVYRTIVLTLTVLFALAAMVRLGDNVLWQDEAETALVSYATAQRGVPNVDLGQNIVMEGGHQYNDEHVWTWQTWMQYYVGAASFLIFGKTAWAARFPFALIGILCIPLTAYLACRLLASRAVGLLSAFFLTANVPYLLFTRQCRNYTLITLAGILLLLAYAGLLRKQKASGLLLAAALVFAFHCHLLVFGGMLFGLLVHYAVMRIRSLRDLGPMVTPLSMAFALTFPWYLYAGGFDRPGQLDPQTFVPNIARFIVWTNNYIFPLMLLGIPLLVLSRSQFRPSPAEPQDRDVRLKSVLILIPLGAVLAWCFCSQIFFRYLVVWIPAAAILLATCIHWLWRSSIPGRRVLCIVIVVLQVTTNIWAFVPLRVLGPPLVEHFKQASSRAKASDQELLQGQCNSASNVLQRRMEFEHPFSRKGCMWGQMIHELTHGMRGSMDAMVNYINEHAKPGDVIWIGYGDLPLIFHTDAKVVSWYMTALEPLSYKNTDWIIPRSFAPFNLLLKGELLPTAAGKFTKAFMPYLEAHYEQASLPITDVLWNNRPDPDSHRFRSSFYPPFVYIFRRITPKEK